MRVLVTGGAGFIGSHVVDLLLKQGYGVRILDSLERRIHPARQRPAHLPPEAEFLRGDVRRRTDWEKALAGVDKVVHLAAYQDYLPDFGKFAAYNDLGTALLYEVIVARRLPIQKVVLGSSQAVYGEGAYGCPQHGLQHPEPRPLAQLQARQWDILCPQCRRPLAWAPTPESAVQPHNQYAVSKYCQELYALVLGRRHGIPTTALRFSISQGARQSFANAYSGILRIFTVRLLTGQPPVLYEDGQQVRDYVYVGDVARAVALALEKPAADYEAYNVGSGQATTVLEYFQLLCRLTGKEVAPEIPGEFRYGDTRHVVSDISKISKLGWRPTMPLERIAAEYLEWAAAQPGLKDYYRAAERRMLRLGTIRKTKA